MELTKLFTNGGTKGIFLVTSHLERFLQFIYSIKKRVWEYIYSNLSMRKNFLEQNWGGQFKSLVDSKNNNNWNH